MNNNITNSLKSSKFSPMLIDNLDNYLKKFFKTGNYVYEERKNVAYSLQYTEYLIHTLNESNVTAVIKTQLIKSIFITATGIIETFLYFLLISTNNYDTSKWKQVKTLSSKEFKIENNTFQLQTVIYRALPISVNKKMDLIAMIQKVKKKKLLGRNNSIYEKLDYIRNLRNKVHLYLVKKDYSNNDIDRDTDYNNFNSTNLVKIADALYTCLTSEYFKPTNDELKMFDYLKVKSS